MELNLQSSVALNYEVNGDGETTFLLFNGATLPLEFWGPFAEALGELGKVVRFDQRNAGKTRYEGRFTLGDTAADAAALLDQLEIERAVVIGHAWGGRAAQVFARDFPDRLSHLVILGTGGQFPPIDMQKVAISMRRAMKEGNRESWEPLFETMWFGAGFAGRDPETFRSVANLLWGYRPPRSAEWNARAYPSPGYWGTARVPTLLVYGNEDKNGTPENARDLKERLPNASLVIVENAGHFIVRECPERVLAEVRTFLAENQVR